MYARESFTIAEVADLLSIRRLSDSYQDEFPVECPFCGDLRGKCSFCIRKNGDLAKSEPDYAKLGDKAGTFFFWNG